MTSITDDALWEELVTSALLGTDRRTPPDTVTATGKDAPAALLDAAAIHTVRRRAGLVPAPAAARPEPAPDDTRRHLPVPARRRLAQLLADRSAPSSGGRRGTAPDLTELLPQWLAAANEQGYRVPPPLLPALLDAARARTDLRPQALAFAGALGLWLARFNPEWKFALRGSSGGGPCCRTCPTRKRCNGCGRRACSRSGSRCWRPYGRMTRTGEDAAVRHLADRAGRGRLMSSTPCVRD